MSADLDFDIEFKQAYEQLFPIIYRVALRISSDPGRAEDMCHEAFLRYYEKGRDIPDLDQVKYWLIRVVKNLSLNSEKRRDRERKAVQRLGRYQVTQTSSVSEDLEKAVEEGAVRDLLQLLPHGQRICLVLKEYEGLTYKEIGRILGISESNVKVRVFRGREKLGQLFKEHFGIDS